MKLRLYKIWGGTRKQSDALYIWAESADEALFQIARKIDPSVNTTQWTGQERSIHGTR